MIAFDNHYTIKHPLGFHWFSPLGTKRHGFALTFLIQPFAALVKPQFCLAKPVWM